MDYSQACWLKHLFFHLISHLSHTILFLVIDSYPTNSKRLLSPAKGTQSRCKCLKTFGREFSIKEPSVWIFFPWQCTPGWVSQTEARLHFCQFSHNEWRVGNVLSSAGQGIHLLQISLFKVTPSFAPRFSLNFPKKGKAYEQQNNGYWILKDKFFPSRIHHHHLFNVMLRYHVIWWIYWFKFRKGTMPAACAPGF